MSMQSPEMKNGINVCYYSNGKGYWLRREWKPQCSAKVFFYGRCQGVRGHKNVHWRFAAWGDFEWADNREDPKHGGCAGSTPPDCDEYPSALEMQEHCHLNQYDDT